MFLGVCFGHVLDYQKALPIFHVCININDRGILTIIEKCIEAVLEKVAMTIHQLCKICSDQFEPEDSNSDRLDSTFFVS